ncbi:MAG: hypothetical protein JSS09_03585, partial [Verrucomicrobia bacterium]|nr:hypothetical protein [Verrucomicrobiota bacterium]
VFSYPGVKPSEGFPGKQAMVNSHLAMLSFLTNSKIGINAEKVVLYGHSIGGGVQREVLLTAKDPKIKGGVKSRSFSDLKDVVAARSNSSWLGGAVQRLNWNIRSVESSKSLHVPEIIMQTAAVETCQELVDNSSIIHDNVIPREATLAKVLLEDLDPKAKANKMFLGLPEKHNENLSNRSMKVLTWNINRMLDGHDMSIPNSISLESDSVKHNFGSLDALDLAIRKKTFGTNMSRSLKALDLAT